MSFRIAISGKGGTGKTTLAGLLISNLAAQGKKILAIDADPNSNLHMVLGIKVEGTIGGLLEEIKEKTNKLEKFPAGMNKVEYLNFKLSEILTEGRGFDLLTMGRPEGPGCYCFANNVLRDGIEALAEKYDCLIMDSAAGMEHFNRKVAGRLDLLILTADATERGLRTAVEIRKLISELGLQVKSIKTVLTMSNNGIIKKLLSMAEQKGLDVAVAIPEDSFIRSFDLEGRPLTDLPESSPAKAGIKELAGMICKNQG